MLDFKYDCFQTINTKTTYKDKPVVTIFQSAVGVIGGFVSTSVVSVILVVRLFNGRNVQNGYKRNS